MTDRVPTPGQTQPGGTVPAAGRPPRPLLRYSFCIAGSQKSGTTSLAGMLDKHPGICPAPRKEMHYFDDETRDWSDPDHAQFVVPGSRRRKQIAGEATPTYLWWPQALQRIHDYNPDMKLIVLFRDPIERLFSQWVMNRDRWPEAAEDWPRFLTRHAPDSLEIQVPSGVHTGGFKVHCGVVRGYYGAQLERGYRIVGREQFHLVEFRHFLASYTDVLDAVTDFLGLERYEAYPPLPHGMRGKETTVGTAPTAADIAGLVETYRADFARFKELSELDVSAWPLQRLIDGTLGPGDLAASLAAKVTPLDGPGTT